jgi:hypothetical protein
MLLARNPDTASSLPYLLRLPLENGLVFRTKGTWPRTSALYCHPVDSGEWPDEPEIVERVALPSCARRDVVFWQSARTRKQSRPQVAVETARAQGVKELEILVDAHERYAYRFAGQQARVVRRGLACGDYAVTVDGRVVCAVERKSV